MPNLPPELSLFEQVDYVLTLKSLPAVDIIEDENAIRVTLDVDTSSQVLGGLNLKIEINVSGDATPDYDNNTQTLSIDLKNANIFKLEITGLIDPPDLPKDVTDKANEILSALIRDKLLDKSIKLPIPAVVLPGVPEQYKINVTFGTIKAVSSDVLAVALNFFEDKEGDPNQLTNFNGGQDICFGISSDAMHHVFEFWWDHTTYDKTFSREFKIDLQTPLTNDILNGLTFTEGGVTSAVTLGALSVSEHIDDENIKLDVTGRFDDAPRFNLMGNGKIGLSLDFHSDLSAEIRINTTRKVGEGCIPLTDVCANHSDEPHHYSSSLGSLNNLPVNVDNAVAELKVQDDSSRHIKWISIKIDSAPNIEVPTGWHLTQEVIHQIFTTIGEFIVLLLNQMAIPVSPGLIVETVPHTSINLAIKLDSLNSDDKEAIACINVTFQ